MYHPYTCNPNEFDDFEVIFQTVLKPRKNEKYKETLIISQEFCNNQQKEKIFIFLPFFFTD